MPILDKLAGKLAHEERIVFAKLADDSTFADKMKAAIIWFNRDNKHKPYIGPDPITDDKDSLMKWIYLQSDVLKEDP